MSGVKGQWASCQAVCWNPLNSLGLLGRGDLGSQRKSVLQAGEAEMLPAAWNEPGGLLGGDVFLRWCKTSCLNICEL